MDTNLSPVAYLKPVDSFKNSLVLFFIEDFFNDDFKRIENDFTFFYFIYRCIRSFSYFQLNR